MSLSTTTPITTTLLDTLLGHLAPHFMHSAGNDLPTARHAASCVLAAYDARTEEELHLAADIISFGFHALAALGQAAGPELSLNRVLRLRGSAVSLSREAHKARRKLDQLRRARLSAAAQPAGTADSLQPTTVLPSLDTSGLDALSPDALSPDVAAQPVSRAASADIWSASGRQRHAAALITANLRRNQVEQERRMAEAACVAPSAQPRPAA